MNNFFKTIIGLFIILYDTIIHFFAKGLKLCTQWVVYKYVDEVFNLFDIIILIIFGIGTFSGISGVIAAGTIVLIIAMLYESHNILIKAVTLTTLYAVMIGSSSTHIETSKFQFKIKDINNTAKTYRIKLGSEKWFGLKINHFKRVNIIGKNRGLYQLTIRTKYSNFFNTKLKENYNVKFIKNLPGTPKPKISKYGLNCSELPLDKMIHMK